MRVGRGCALEDHGLGLEEREQAFDATLTTDAAGRPALQITNPTKFPASVKIFSETSAAAKTRILGAVSLESPPRAEVAPGATVLYPL